MLRGSFGCKPWVKRASKSKGDSGVEDEEENEVKKACNEKIVKKWLIDDAVGDLIEMELKNRKKEEDTKGFEEGSEYWLNSKFGNWNRIGMNSRPMKPKQRARQAPLTILTILKMSS